MAQQPNQPLAPTLTDVTQVGRQVLKYTIIILVSYMVLKMLLGAFISYWQAVHPEPPPPPTVGFGKLPSLNFPEQAELSKPKSYVLETASGGFPEFTDRIKVFFMPQSTANLLADEQARQIAARYDFVFEPEILNSSTYRWTKTEPLETTFEINIKTLNFNLTADFLAQPNLDNNTPLPDDFESVSRVKSFLAKTDLLPADVATNSGQLTYLKSLGGQLKKAAALSDAEFVQVDLDRYPVDGQYQMYTPGGEEGIIRAIISSAFKQDESIVELDYRYQPIDYTQVETYPLRSPAEAWRIVQAGQAYIIDPGDDPEAVIREVELGYFDDFKEQSYLQPIYVFLGDGDFMAYVSAIDPTYIIQD